MSEYIKMNDALIYNYQKDIIDEKDKEIERLNKIIKEVREYIQNNSYFEDNIVKTMVFKDYSNGILEILDKENNDNV